MKRYISILAILALAVLGSCKKDSGTSVEPSTGGDTSEIRLHLQGGDVQTKALVTADNIATQGNEFKVYDLVSSTDGTLYDETGAVWTDFNAYIDDRIKYNSEDDAWDYASGHKFYWTKTGLHKFFAWYNYDAMMNLSAQDFFGKELNITDGSNVSVLEIPSKTLTTTSDQFDMLYSTVVARSMNEENPNHDPVQVYFNHLFSAISISVSNSMADAKVHINSITIPNLKNKGSATISFAGAGSALVDYGERSVDEDTPFMAEVSGLDLDEADGTSTSIDLFTLEEKTSSDASNFEKRLIWPQKLEDVSPSTLIDTANLVYASADSLIVLDYDLTIDGVTRNYQRRAKFPSKAWKPGTWYHFNLQFVDKMLYITTEILPWDYGDYQLSYEDWTVSAGQLSFPNYKTVEKVKTESGVTEKRVKISNGVAPTGKFWIQTPVNGKYFIKMDGDTEYFSIDGSTGTINPLQDGGYVTFTINPNLTLTRDSDKSITLGFSVEMNDRSVDATSEVCNGDVWRIILPKE